MLTSLRMFTLAFIIVTVVDVPTEPIPAPATSSGHKSSKGKSVVAPDQEDLVSASNLSGHHNPWTHFRGF